MPLYWLCYRHNNQISVVIQPGASPIHARMRAREITIGDSNLINVRFGADSVAKRFCASEAQD
jgi:hypothetical protein